MSKRKRPGKPAAHRTKRERFEEAGRFPVKKVAIVAVVVVVICVGAVLGFHAYQSSQNVGGTVVSQGGADYSNSNVEMSLLTSFQKTTSGTVTLSEAEVTSKKIGGAVYSRSTPMPASFDLIQGNGLPLLAYVAPSGRLVVATSMCEPCRSYQFHIEGNDLVCNTCFTHWDLNTLKGVSGGCLDFPPQEVKTVVQGGTIQVQQSDLEAWAPRI
jgi:uncharacterized protein